MAELLEPTPFPVPGGKEIHEVAGRVSSGHTNVSVARMSAPPGWEEPAQRPEFDEVTYVIEGSLEVTAEGEKLTVAAGQSVLSRAGDQVRYSAGSEGAEYLAVCVPAFSEDAAHRAN